VYFFAAHVFAVFFPPRTRVPPEQSPALFSPIITRSRQWAMWLLLLDGDRGAQVPQREFLFSHRSSLFLC